MFVLEKFEHRCRSLVPFSGEPWYQAVREIILSVYIHPDSRPVTDSILTQPSAARLAPSVANRIRHHASPTENRRHMSD
ncbi:uncharacterized protein [Mycetomoellerius zeteki]|uniref:uncharacterized protein isoform X2 n=1 Tax=Mycetomoellerius zeteki TaxID=64791 RepID=UPI00084EC3D4|nr:PREDICTED: uncharacterized protein LOC108730045 isoform X2 [Trachymyrmex zeteki]